MSTNPLPFGAVPGFDLGKIQDLTHVNDKYSPALRSFSQALAAGIPLTRGNLAPQVDWAHGHGFANAKQVGDDSIDYGDTRGPIDLIRGSDDAPMFLDKAVWGSAPPAPANTTPTRSSALPTDSTQSDLVRQALLQLGGGMAGGDNATTASSSQSVPMLQLGGGMAGGSNATTGSSGFINPELPIPMPPQSNPNDQVLGNYDDLLQREIRKQMQTEPQP